MHGIIAQDLWEGIGGGGGLDLGLGGSWGVGWWWRFDVHQPPFYNYVCTYLVVTQVFIH